MNAPDERRPLGPVPPPPAPAAASPAGAPRTGWVVLAAGLGMLAVLWGMAIPLSWLPEPIGSNASEFAAGARTTVALTLVAGVGGLVLGVMAGLGKRAAARPVRWLCVLYIGLIRGTPLLVQVLFVYFALPVILPALEMSDFASAAVALGLNVGAYNAEAIRAGLQAVPRGQIEAARSLGLTRWQTFADVSLPQAMRVALPPLVNNLVALLKDSSLAYAIGVVELTNIGNRIQAATFQPLPVLATTAIIYLILTTLMTQVAGAIEQRWHRQGKA